MTGESLWGASSYHTRRLRRPGWEETELEPPGIPYSQPRARPTSSCGSEPRVWAMRHSRGPTSQVGLPLWGTVAPSASCCSSRERRGNGRHIGLGGRGHAPWKTRPMAGSGFPQLLWNFRPWSETWGAATCSEATSKLNHLHWLCGDPWE